MTDIHATGWLMSAARSVGSSRSDPPSDRLGAEDGAPAAAALEVRLIPNAAENGRAYYAEYLRAVAYHHARHGRRDDWWARRRALPPPSSASDIRGSNFGGGDAGVVDDDEDAKIAHVADGVGGGRCEGRRRTESVGPVCVVLRPVVYGRHWRHVIDTAAAAAALTITATSSFPSPASPSSSSFPIGAPDDRAEVMVAGSSSVSCPTCPTCSTRSSSPTSRICPTCPARPTGLKRSKPRVTSGYLFLLTALELTGQPLPGEDESEPGGNSWDRGRERELDECEGDAEKATTIEESGSGEPSVDIREESSGGGGGIPRRRSEMKPHGSVTLYGFEDDARNVADASGGHYFDSLHKQHRSLYDLGWEREVMAGLAERGRCSGELAGDCACPGGCVSIVKAAGVSIRS